MSDYQTVKIEAIDGATIRMRVTEVHPDRTELRRIVDRQGQLRRSVVRRLPGFAALLLVEYAYGKNSLVESLRLLVDVGAAPSLKAAAGKLIAEVAFAGMEEIGAGTDGPMHRATVTITARSPLVFRSFARGSSHGAVATLDGDIEL